MSAKRELFGQAPRSPWERWWRYRFAPPGEEAWWERERLGTWLEATSLNDPGFRDFLRAQGFVD